jgi:hypothetical protein
VTAIRADYEFAIAFRVPPPPRPPVPPPPRRLERRCGGRHFFHDRRVDRNGARTRSTSNRKPSRQAEKEECVAHECLPGSPRRQRTALPFSSTCSARCASNRWVSHGEHIQLHPSFLRAGAVITRGPEPRRHWQVWQAVREQGQGQVSPPRSLCSGTKTAGAKTRNDTNYAFASRRRAIPALSSMP